MRAEEGWYIGFMTNQICLTFSALAVLLIVGCSSGVEPRPLSFTFEELRSTAFIDSLLALEEYRTPEGSELVFGLKYGMTWSEVYDRSKELETNTGGKVYHWDVDNIAAEVANIEVRGLIDGFTYRANFVDDLGKSYQASYLLSPRYEDRRLVEVSIFFKGDLGLKLQKSIEKRLRADNPKWLNDLIACEFAESQEDVVRSSRYSSNRGGLDSNNVFLPNLRSKTEGGWTFDAIPLTEILLEQRKKAVEYEAAKARSTEDIF